MPGSGYQPRNQWLCHGFSKEADDQSRWPPPETGLRIWPIFIGQQIHIHFLNRHSYSSEQVNSGGGSAGAAGAFATAKFWWGAPGISGRGRARWKLSCDCRHMRQFFLQGRLFLRGANFPLPLHPKNTFRRHCKSTRSTVNTRVYRLYQSIVNTYPYILTVDTHMFVFFDISKYFNFLLPFHLRHGHCFASHDCCEK